MTDPLSSLRTAHEFAGQAPEAGGQLLELALDRARAQEDGRRPIHAFLSLANLPPGAGPPASRSPAGSSLAGIPVAVKDNICTLGLPTAAVNGLETVIGLEVHVQLRTVSKMFCGCPVRFGAPPNTLVCPVCLGLPGALPVANEEAVRLAVRAAHVLGCTVNATSEFVRKQYFYPDLPKGYQITQLADPLARGGAIDLPSTRGGRRVRLNGLHLEEDAGKSIHDRFEGATAVDLNRAGVPLIEIVTDPDLRSPEEARFVLSRLKQLLEHYAKVSDCNMEEGSLRVDANVSVRPAGAESLGTRVEIKNLNSFGNVQRALAFEGRRMAQRLAAGRTGDAPLRCRPEEDADFAWQGGGARLPLLSGARSPAGRAVGGRGGGAPPRAPGEPARDREEARHAVRAYGGSGMPDRGDPGTGRVPGGGRGPSRR